MTPSPTENTEELEHNTHDIAGNKYGELKPIPILPTENTEELEK